MLDRVLAGLKVLDLTQNVAGPYCSQILGDFGAEVIKIERPGRGDDTRDWRPPEIAGQSATFLALNRNKSSICLDLDSPEGVALLKRLAAGADVVLHSLKPGSAEARGFGPDDLRAVNPRIIYGAISAFGAVGPLKSQPGYDPLMQAFTGIMSTTGHEGDDPVRVGVSLVDMGTGMWLAMGVLAAVLERSRTGEGVLLETSLLDTGIAWMTVVVSGYLATQRLPRKLGSAIAMTAPYEVFPSQDGHFFVAAGNDGLFRRVCAGLGLPDLPADPRFAGNPDRVANRDALREALSAATRLKPTATLVADLRRAGAPCSELNDVGQMLAHPQVEASGMIRDLPVEDAPGHKVVALPIKADGARSGAMRAPEALGAGTEAVLAGLGLAPDEIARLRAAGTIG